MIIAKIGRLERAGQAHTEPWQQARLALLDSVKPYLDALTEAAARTSDGRYHPQVMDDLSQVGMISVLGALRHYLAKDGKLKGKQQPFTAFVSMVWKYELANYRNNSWDAHIPEEIRASASKLRLAISLLTTELGRAPSHNELVEYLNLPPAIVTELLTHLPKRHGREIRSSRGTRVGLMRGNENVVVASKATMVAVVSTLHGDEQDLLRLHFAPDDVLADRLATRLALSRAGLRQRVAEVVQKVRGLHPELVGLIAPAAVVGSEGERTPEHMGTDMRTGAPRKSELVSADTAEPGLAQLVMNERGPLEQNEVGGADSSSEPDPTRRAVSPDGTRSQGSVPLTSSEKITRSKGTL